MSDPITRKEHRDDIGVIHKRISDKDDEAKEAREKINGKLDTVLALLADHSKTAAAFFASHQNLKNVVEGPDGEGGLKKKSKISRKHTGARLVPFSFWSLFLGFLGR